MDGTKEAEAMLRGQAEIWEHLFAFAGSMALKCAVELRLADIIHSHGGPITLSQLASGINSTASPDTDYLSRVMRLLVRKNIFTIHPPSESGEALYGPTRASRWMLRDSEASLAPMIILQSHPIQMAPWHQMGNCVRDGGIAFERAHGMEIWDFASLNPGFNVMVNDAMDCTTNILLRSFLEKYKDGFTSTGTLVDLAGGTGLFIAGIVKANPHIKGINFDLPHVIATAPERQGVTHVGGDMFDTIPSADSILMKWILHDWSDENCIKILKMCRKAIPEKTGKVVIVDIVIIPEDKDLFAEMRMICDAVMMAHTTGGKERTENEWKKILEQGGFPCYKITKIESLPSIIEAFPRLNNI